MMSSKEPPMDSNGDKIDSLRNTSNEDHTGTMDNSDRMDDSTPKTSTNDEGDLVGGVQVPSTANEPIDPEDLSGWVPMEGKDSAKAEDPRNGTAYTQECGREEQRADAVNAADLAGVANGENNKAKTTPTNGGSGYFEHECEAPPLNKFKYDPNMELAVARAVPYGEDKNEFQPNDKSKLDIKQVAKPAFEYKLDERENSKSFCRRYAMILGGCGVLGVVVIVLLVTLLFPEEVQNDLQSRAPSMAPSLSPTDPSRKRQIIAILAQLSPEVLVPGTPDFIAADWILYSDPLRFDKPKLRQRFALAVLYFSSTQNGSRPWRSCNPPLSDSEENDALGSDTLGKKFCTFLEWNLSNDGSSVIYKEVPGKVRWLSDRDECEWEGVICSENNEVKAIRLVGQGLTGNLDLRLTSDDDNRRNWNVLLRAFPSLRGINLSYNELTGTIPSVYGHFSNLVQLELHDNSLSGEIPTSLFQNLTSLQQLNIGDNKLEGTLSTQIGQLTLLRGLHLYENNLKGSLPTEIRNLSAVLTHFRIYGNEFVGTLSTEFGELTGLVDLDFSNNRFTGTIPTQFGQLTNMDQFRIDNNLLTGTIPVELFKMSNSQVIRVDGNALTGLLPGVELLQLQKLVQFTVSNNQLTGSIPTQLGYLSSLRLAWLHLNQFTGDVPMDVCDAASIPNTGLNFLQADCAPIDNAPNPCRCCSACCDRSTDICTSTKYKH